MSKKPYPRWMPKQVRLMNRLRIQYSGFKLIVDEFYTQNHTLSEVPADKKAVLKFLLTAFHDRQKTEIKKNIFDFLFFLKGAAFLPFIILPFLIDYFHEPINHSWENGLLLWLASLGAFLILLTILIAVILLIDVFYLNLDNPLGDFFLLVYLATLICLVCRHFFVAPIFPCETLAIAATSLSLCIVYLLLILYVVHPLIDNSLKKERINNCIAHLAYDSMMAYSGITEKGNDTIDSKNEILMRLEQMARKIKNELPYFLVPADELTEKWMTKSFTEKANWVRQLKTLVIIPGPTSKEKLGNELAQMFWLFYNKNLMHLKGIEVPAPLPFFKRFIGMIGQILISLLPLGIVFAAHLSNWSWLPVGKDAQQWIWLATIGWAVFNMLYNIDSKLKDKLDTFKSFRDFGRSKD